MKINWREGGIRTWSVFAPILVCLFYEFGANTILASSAMADIGWSEQLLLAILMSHPVYRIARWCIVGFIPVREGHTKLLIRSGLYSVDGTVFRVFSNGRVSVLKSDVKPSDGAGPDFSSIGWFLRGFPDVDLSGIRRIDN